MKRLDAVNKALTLIGVATISSLTQDIQAARVMKELFPSVELAVLTEFPWNQKACPLILLPEGSAVPPPEGWKYAFRYPRDALAIYQVYARDMSVKIDYFAQRTAGQPPVIYTNEPEANIEYLAELDFELWPNPAAEAFTARLASDAAAALAGSPQLSSALLQKYTLLISMAKNLSLNEQHISFKRASHYLDVRN